MGASVSLRYETRRRAESATAERNQTEAQDGAAHNRTQPQTKNAQWRTSRHGPESEDSNKAGIRTFGEALTSSVLPSFARFSALALSFFSLACAQPSTHAQT